MSYVVTIENVTPPPRDDATAWTTARIEEAPRGSDLFVAVQAIALDPLDVDPADPQPRDLTTELAQYADGRYRVVFIDATGDESPPSTPTEVTTPSATDVLAAVEETMAYRLRASGFGQGGGGREVQHFTDTTTPTRARAESVSARKAAEVARDFDVSASELADLVTIAALRAAIELEASAPNMDEARIRTWRDQLREYVTKATVRGDAADEASDGAQAMGAKWGFGPGPNPGPAVYDAEAYVEGAEVPLEPLRRRRMW